MTEQEEREYERWRRSHSIEELSKLVYDDYVEPYFYNWERRERYRASESAIRDYYEYQLWKRKEQEKSRERWQRIYEQAQIFREREKARQIALSRQEQAAQCFGPVSVREPEPTAEQVAINRRAGEAFFSDLLAKSGRL